MARFILLLKLQVSAMMLCPLKMLPVNNLKNSTHFLRNYFVKGEIF